VQLLREDSLLTFLSKPCDACASIMRELGFVVDFFTARCTVNFDYTVAKISVNVSVSPSLCSSVINYSKQTRSQAVARIADRTASQ